MSPRTHGLSYCFDSKPAGSESDNWMALLQLGINSLFCGYSILWALYQGAELRGEALGCEHDRKHFENTTCLTPHICFLI